MNESRTRTGADRDGQADSAETGSTRRRVGVVAAVLVTAGLAAATALLPSPAQAQDRTGPPAVHAAGVGPTQV